MGSSREKRAQKIHEYTAHTSSINCLQIGQKTSERIVTGADDRKVCIWSIGQSAASLTLSGHSSPVESVAFDFAEEQVLAGAASGTVKIWDLAEAKVTRTFTGHRSNCMALDHHPFGAYFASGSMDTNIKLWDIRQKECTHTLKGHSRGITCMKFTPDGRWLVSGGEDGIVKLWDVASGKLLHDFKGHEEQINCMDLHPHELFIATGSSDRTSKFWDLETFELVGSAGPEGTGVKRMMFSPDGRSLLSASAENLKVWSWEPVKCLDAVNVNWSKVAELSIKDGKLFGASFTFTTVRVWMVDLSRVVPFGAPEDGTREKGGRTVLSNASANSPLHPLVSKEAVPDSLPDTKGKGRASRESHTAVVHRRASSGSKLSLPSPSFYSSRSSNSRAHHHSDATEASKQRLAQMKLNRRSPAKLSDLSPSRRRASTAPNVSNDDLVIGASEVTRKPPQMPVKTNLDNPSSGRSDPSMDENILPAMLSSITPEAVPSSPISTSLESMLRRSYDFPKKSSEALPHESHPVDSDSVSKVASWMGQLSKVPGTTELQRPRQPETYRGHDMDPSTMSRVGDDFTSQRGPWDPTTHQGSFNPLFVSASSQADSIINDLLHAHITPPPFLSGASPAHILPQAAFPERYYFPQAQWQQQMESDGSSQIVSWPKSMNSSPAAGDFVRQGISSPLHPDMMVARDPRNTASSEGNFLKHVSENNSDGHATGETPARMLQGTQKQGPSKLPKSNSAETSTTVRISSSTAPWISQAGDVLPTDNRLPAGSPLRSSFVEQTSFNTRQVAEHGRREDDMAQLDSFRRRASSEEVLHTSAGTRLGAAGMRVAQSASFAPSSPLQRPWSPSQGQRSPVSALRSSQQSATTSANTSPKLSARPLGLDMASFMPPPEPERAKAESPSDAQVLAEIQQNHSTFLSIMRSRHSKLETIRTTWIDGDLLGTFELLSALTDPSVLVDVLNVMRGPGGRVSFLNLDGCAALLPLLQSLLDSSHDSHVEAALGVFLELLRVFGDLITSTRSATRCPGVDLHADLRLERCKMCHDAFKSTVPLLEPLFRRVSLAKLARELQAALLKL